MFADESDAHLVDQARQGIAAAFAVLVYRYADTAFEPTAPDPRKAAVATFVRAMQQLANDQAHEDFGAWLADLGAGDDAARGAAITDTSDTQAGDANDGRSRPAPNLARDGQAEPQGRRFTSDDIDAIWSELARRWPNGRRGVRVPQVAVWAATVVATIVVSAAVPWLLLTQFGEEPSIQELRAFPIYDERDQEPAQIDDLDDAEDPLPTFEFPTPPEELVEPDAPPEPAANDTDSGSQDAGDDSADPDQPGDANAQDPVDEDVDADSGGDADDGGNAAEADGDTNDSAATDG